MYPSDYTISYSPYSNIAPLTAAEIVIHGENTASMLVMYQAPEADRAQHVGKYCHRGNYWT